ncbi:hypothetical protein K493DRAFT_407323 [Basidiobolus meristosporus CBS 931.73]|uniref:Mid2 domain-containing protein n=1 Tax=Basidiobolus meristosporus CBS 931.73 TaxID=1314790 RepID=A0A1Y1YE02_9FUNG|nr:hypothetical protein K493DRAFT_407323 [Basidiobolus meristosporus CBS 931.73]|eukprot:ORX96198.1 hypothetical protein K493DRAFT_407323 [Basidiobolus meristosporus CBS 931.73]
MDLGLAKYCMLRLQLLLLFGLNAFVRGMDDVPDNIIGGSYLDSNCGPDLYCLPVEDELWRPLESGLENGFVRWNRYYPTFSTYVNISLFNTESEVPVKEWHHYKNEGLLVINNFPSSWFIGVNLTANVTQEFYFYITGPYTPTVVIPRGPSFYIQKPVILPVHSSPATTSVSSSHISTSTSSTSTTHSSAVATMTPTAVAPSLGAQNSSSNNLSAGAISGITVGSVAGITIIACLVYFLRRRRRNQAHCYVANTDTDSDPSLVRSLHSSSADAPDLEVDAAMEMAEPSSPVRRNSLRLTVKGAQELAHAYRKMLTNQEMAEESPAQNQTRILYSDELLRRELAADGHGVKYVSTAPAIVVMGDDQQSLHSMAANTSDSSEIP